MSSPSQIEKPRFTAVKIHNHPAGHLSLWYPPEWDLQETDVPHPAVTLYPEPKEPATYLSVEVQDLGAPLDAEEQTLLADGVRQGLAQLADCHIETLRALNSDDVGDWGQEWICTFADGGQRRKRRARLFCSGRHLYSVVCQGANEARYGYWRGMLEWVLMTVGMNPISLAQWAEEQPMPDHTG